MLGALQNYQIINGKRDLLLIQRQGEVRIRLHGLHDITAVHIGDGCFAADHTVTHIGRQGISFNILVDGQQILLGLFDILEAVGSGVQVHGAQTAADVALRIVSHENVAFQTRILQIFIIVCLYTKLFQLLGVPEPERGSSHVGHGVLAFRVNLRGTELGIDVSDVRDDTEIHLLQQIVGQHSFNVKVGRNCDVVLSFAARQKLCQHLVIGLIGGFDDFDAVLFLKTVENFLGHVLRPVVEVDFFCISGG